MMELTSTVCPKCDGTQVEAFYLTDLNMHHLMCACGKEWVE